MTTDSSADESGNSSTESARDPDSADSMNSLLEGEGGECVQSCIEVECTTTCADESHQKSERRSNICCNTVGQSVWGVLLLIISVGGFIFTPLDFMLWEKLNMRPGFPPYEWWLDPPDEVLLRAYVFNVTNHEEFINGTDTKLNVQEIGPIVYLEKLLHYNVRFNENSTMTYTAERIPIYLPDKNNIDLNATIIVPNLAVLGVASFLHSQSFFVRGAFRFLVTSHNSQFFVKKTIYEYLWDLRDPVLDTSKNVVPGLVPVNNMGMLARVYADFIDEVTVTYGPQFGHKRFFEIENFRGAPQLPGYDPDKCPDRLLGGTEGVMYHQHITKDDTLYYWRKTACRLMPLYFKGELVVDDVPVYSFNLSEHALDRVQNGTDCYDTKPSLPHGISDASKCFFNFPMVASFPHFFAGEVPKDHYVTGLQPDISKHNSYTLVEPLTGTPFRSVARLQSNLQIHDLSGFSIEYDRFSNSIIPLFWLEYNQEGLPQKIQSMIHFMAVILPPLSNVLLTTMLLLGCYLILKQIYKHNLYSESLNTMLKRKNVNTLAKNKILAYEKENFLKTHS